MKVVRLKEGHLAIKYNHFATGLETAKILFINWLWLQSLDIQPYNTSWQSHPCPQIIKKQPPISKWRAYAMHLEVANINIKKCGAAHEECSSSHVAAIKYWSSCQTTVNIIPWRKAKEIAVET